MTVPGLFGFGSWTGLLAGMVLLANLVPFSFAQSGSIASNPVIERMQIRIDAMESEIARLSGRIDSMGFEIGQARKEAANAVDQITGMEVLIAELTARLERIESVVNAPALAAEEAARRLSSGQRASNDASGTGTTEDFASDLFGDGQYQAPLSGRGRSDPVSISPRQEGVTADPRGLPVMPDLADTADELFVQARQFLLQGEYSSAEKAFDSFISSYPDHTNIGEAYYWLAESLFIQEAWPQAAQTYVTLLSDHPTTAKAPEGLVRLARTLRKMGDLEQACAILRELPGRYPSAPPVIVSIAATERARSRCTS